MSAGEIRIPNKLISSALAGKHIKHLRLFALAKMEGHRAEIKPLCECLKIKPKTCHRLVTKIVADGWAGSDDVYLFPRSWRKLHLSKYGGQYLEAPRNLKILKDIKKFEALCFAKALKKVYMKLTPEKGKSTHSKTGRKKSRIMQEDFPTGYLSKSLGISERRFERLKASAARYKFIRVKPQTIELVGKASELPAWRKNYPDRAFFETKGGYCYSPEISKIRVLI